MDKDLLATYGIDFDRGLKNCMGNEAFYKKILSMFLEDQCFVQAEKAYRDENWKELFSRMHELKGISGNAALMTLYGITVPLVELLRSGQNQRPDEVARFFGDVGDAYRRAREGINLLLQEK